LLNLGHALGRLGDLDGAANAFAQAAALGPEAGPLLAALGRRYQAGVEIARGRLGAAGQLYRQAHELALARGFGRLPATGIILEGMADLAYLRNDLDEAMRLAGDALERGLRGGEVKISVPAHVVMGRVLAARGDFDGALDQTDNAIALSHWPSTDAWRARFLLRAGEISCAQRWATESGCDSIDSLESVDEFVLITYIRVLDAIGRERERDWLLKGLRERTVTLGRVTSRIEIDLLIAQAAAAAGRMDEAVDRLLPALLVGESAGHIRLFLDEGPRLGPLLARAERAIDGGDDQPTPGFVARLRSLLAAEQPVASGAPVANGGLIEPLTPREREVLKLIGDGRSNQAIADTLYLSIGSVKTHSSHVYGKLGVRGRTEAIARARALGLLA
jgi:LuxR family maltose regulon positive regulatory protein